MTFAIPPRQLKFARRLAPDEDDNTHANGKSGEEKMAANGIVEDIAGAPRTGDAEIGETTTQGAKISENGVGDTEVGDTTIEQCEAGTNNGGVQDINREDTSEGHKAGDATCSDGSCYTGSAMVAPPSPASSSSSELSAIPPDVNDVILFPITTLQALEDKIVTIDGRLGRKVDGNAFKKS